MCMAFPSLLTMYDVVWHKWSVWKVLLRESLSATEWRKVSAKMPSLFKIKALHFACNSKLPKTPTNMIIYPFYPDFVANYRCSAGVSQTQVLVKWTIVAY